MAVNYENFDILLIKTGEFYQARIIASPAGQAHIHFSVPDDVPEFESFIKDFTRTRSLRVKNRISTNEKSSADEALKAFGGKLFDAIFKDDVATCLRDSLFHTKGKGLRIRLLFSSDAPELMTLPWEYLYNTKENRYLSLSVNTPIVRYPEHIGKSNILSVQVPLKILVVISSPSELPALNVEKEWQDLKASLAGLEAEQRVILKRLFSATKKELQHQLQREDYHILHYIGHSDFDENTGKGLLLLEDEQGNTSSMQAESLGKLLHDETSIRLVILNSCEGGKSSRTDFFAGVAMRLIEKQIPAVIAMQFEITDKAAIIFSTEFYTALAHGYPVEAALTEARKAIDIRLNPVEWGTPTLYMRSSDGNLFAIEKEPVPAIQPFFTSTGDGGLNTNGNDQSSRSMSKFGILGGGLLVALGVIAGSFWFKGDPDPGNTNGGVTDGFPPITSEPGFDCTFARTVTEKAICAYPTVAKVDNHLNQVFSKIKNKIPPPKTETLFKKQLKWLRSRDEHVETHCISSFGEVNPNCLISYYNKRITTLKKKAPKLTKFKTIEALVIEPPSNVRIQPQEKVLCQVRSKKRIAIYKTPETDKKNKFWYWTKICGEWGVIHESQIEF